jgi:peptidoglycan/LPS O-acetylase OafA/YrhL
MPDRNQLLESKNEPAHFGYIDAVRGMAFLGVLATHAAGCVGAFPYGYVFAGGLYGVQLFFLASAITLCYSMSSRVQRDAYPTLYFYLRRFFRIAPLFWVAIIFYWSFPKVMPAFWLGEWAPLGVHPMYFVLTAFFLHGWHPYTFNSIVPGGWSIAVEMSFYLLFPLIFRFLGKSLRRSVAAVLLSIAYVHILDRFLPRIHYFFFRGVPEGLPWRFFEAFWFPAQLPVFLVGFLVYRLMKNDSVARVTRSGFWTGYSLAFALMVVLTEIAPPSHGFITAYPLVVLCLGLGGSILALSGGTLSWFVNPVIRYIGRISYSCYLVHFAALGMTLKLLGVHLTAGLPSIDTGHSAGNLWLFVKISTITLGLTVPIATITLHTIENPGIALGRRLLARISASREGRAVLT